MEIDKNNICGKCKYLKTAYKSQQHPLFGETRRAYYYCEKLNIAEIDMYEYACEEYVEKDKQCTICHKSIDNGREIVSNNFLGVEYICDECHDKIKNLHYSASFKKKSNE